MADPGLTQVTKALQTVITHPGFKVFVDRDESAPVQEEERPCAVIRTPDIAADEMSSQEGEAVINWQAIFEIDFYEDSQDSDNISFAHDARIAHVWTLLQADDTLGSLVYWMAPAGITANSDQVADVGVAIFGLDLRWMTKRDDWTVIIF